MNNKYAFIWDLDGTILDSYAVIVTSLQKTYSEFGWELSKDMILRFVINNSVRLFVEQMAVKTGISAELVNQRYYEISNVKKSDIKAIKHAKAILEYIVNNGMDNFVFTHRDSSSLEILTNLKLKHLFIEIVTAENGFLRKPSASALDYLIDKYNLNKQTTFYVGDRLIDMKCAANANIRGIMYLPKTSVAKQSNLAEYVIQDLLDIKQIIEICK